jgi:hypothetical protein
MRILKMTFRTIIGISVLLGIAACAQSDRVTGLEGYGQLSGTVTGSEPGVLPVVYANNIENDVAYTVFVVDGK